MKGALLVALDLDKLKPRKNDDYTVRKGGNGFGINLNEVAYTVDTTIVHGIAICALAPSCSAGVSPPARGKRP